MNTADRGLALVTGGAGFIGSHLVEGLIDRGHPVRVVDSLATGSRSNLGHLDPSRWEWVEGDLRDFEVCRAACRDVRWVFHEAAIPSVPRSVENPLQSFASGPMATLNLLEAARQAGVDRLVFAASSSAYGDVEELPKRESMAPSPMSPYASGKLASEYDARVYARTMGLDTVSLRYFNVFGPRQDPSSPYSGVISLFSKLMAEGKRPTIYGDGEQTRDFTYVANVVQANLKAIDAGGPLGGEVFNVGTGDRVSLKALVGELNRLLGTSIEPSFQAGRAGDVQHSLASLDKIRERLGYEPTVGFAEGLRKTLGI